LLRLLLNKHSKINKKNVIARLKEQFPEMSREKRQKHAKNVGMKVHLNGSAPARSLLHWVW